MPGSDAGGVDRSATRWISSSVAHGPRRRWRHVHGASLPCSLSLRCSTPHGPAGRRLRRIGLSIRRRERRACPSGSESCDAPSRYASEEYRRSDSRCSSAASGVWRRAEIASVRFALCGSPAGRRWVDTASSGAADAARTDTWIEKEACPCAPSSSAMNRGGLFWAKADSPVGLVGDRSGQNSRRVCKERVGSLTSWRGC